MDHLVDGPNIIHSFHCKFPNISACNKISFDIAITVDFKSIQRRKNLRWVSVIIVGPRSNGVATNVGVGYLVLLNPASNFALLFIHI
uniref:Uncharacterized protein n=1 Tax=Rhizophora mucronata TaxID=61149 RepID=A0A2P2IZ13_RHIMU